MSKKILGALALTLASAMMTSSAMACTIYGIGKDATPACFDSWRVVDQPLTADQLLNHGFPRGTLIRIK